MSVRTPTAGEMAWLMAIPTAIVAVWAIALLGPPLGKALLAPSDVRFWPILAPAVRPEPVEQGRFLIALAAPVLLAALTVVGVRLRPRRASLTIEALVAATQIAAGGFVVVCLLRQDGVFGPLYAFERERPRLYFTPATLVVAAAGTVAVILVIRSARRRASLMSWTRETRNRRLAAGCIALAAIVVWLLHGIFTEATIGAAHDEVNYHFQFLFDETFAVLNGRSPLVDFAAQYGSLLPYAFAGGLRLLGESTGVWIAMALFTTGLGMVAIYAVLRRAAHSSIRGLLLFLPVLATSFFMVGGTLENRYTFGDYYGTFPMRYAGPSLLAWLVARHLAGVTPRRSWPLFLAAGLVVLNNADTGIAALGATVAGLLWSGGRPTRASVARLALEAAGGLAAAFALVSLLTLVRAGALPDLGLLLRFSRLFAVAGFGLYAMPTIGLHTVIYLTYVAALGMATVRALRPDEDRLLTGMLAWSAVFGLGAGAYFAGRSTSDDLPAMFFPWSLTLALLLVPTLRTLTAASRRRPQVAAVACLFGFLVTACSLAQTPTPWGQLDRLQHTAQPPTEPVGERFIAKHTQRGETVAILALLGHRIGVDLDVTDISLYASSRSMPSAEQVDETIAALRAAGGHKVFVSLDDSSTEMQQQLEEAGYAFTTSEPTGETGLWVEHGRR